ncbi:hypothetical protein PROFUN_12033 [Planoprotostelium fungivorum]|uniref:Uncharacterized protein n=1 Tax=Planoprotostelium fungivorum TaxID=1890364 RepID=A0A2P6MRI5_9EUKA|nr:hypothetical protein PROFUN_12033 [Planoprotostelium fungivorum]
MILEGFPNQIPQQLGSNHQPSMSNIINPALTSVTHPTKVKHYTSSLFWNHVIN